MFRLWGGVRSLVGGVIGLVGALYIMVLTVKRATYTHDAAVFVVGVAVALVYALGGVEIIVHGRRRQEYEAARQAVALGTAARARVATEPPTHISVPPLPFTIDHRPNWTRISILSCLLALILELIVITVLLFQGATWYQALQALPLSLVVVVPMVLLATFGLMVPETHQRLIVNADGLTIRKPMQVPQSISWDDAQLFAICPPGKAGTPPICYELATPTVRVQWIRVQPSMPFLPLPLKAATKLAISFAEYDQEMESLIAFVMARTGLPLHDLREGPEHR